jgi:pimeloyl-ACP methyl ester carboxylesterase
MAPESLDYCADGRLERFPKATHWVVHERPDEVADLLREHLGAADC